MTEHHLPYDENAEKSVIGSILMDYDKIVDICVEKKLSKECFYITSNNLVYECIMQMHTENKVIDILTLTDRLRENGVLDKIGGAGSLDKMQDVTPVTAHAEYYIDIVKKHSLSRKIIALCTEGMNKGYTYDDPEVLRSRLESAFTNMERKIDGIDVGKVFDTMKNDIIDGLAGKKIEVGLTTGYKSLDNLMEGGFRRGGVYCLSGEEASGKTSLKCNIVNRLLKKGFRIADWNGEMSVTEEIEKMTAIELGQNVSELKKNRIGCDGVGAKEKLKELEKLFVESGRLHLSDQSTVSSTVEMWSWARRMVYRHKVDIIVIDYLQLIQVPDNEHMRIEEQTSKQSECVKNIAGTLNIPVFVLAAANMDGKIRGSRKADYDVAGHWRLEKDRDSNPQPKMYEEQVTLNMKKSRFSFMGESAKEILTFYGLTGKFEDNHERRREEEFRY